MKVFFFEPYALAIPHFETALELMQDHINAGDEVYFYNCSANLEFCESNPIHAVTKCVDCITRGKNGLNLIEGIEKIHVKQFVNLDSKSKKIIEHWNLEFNTIEELKAFEYEGMDLGMAVASSVISHLRDPNADPLKNKELVTKVFRSALKVYFSFQNTIKEAKPDLVYFFNGRFSNLRVLLRLCEQNKITYRIHERGANKFKYMLFENHLPHSVKDFIKLVKNNWENAPDSSSKEKIGAEFYTKRKFGEEQGWHSFVAEQNNDELPASWNPSKRNIIIFNSSEDEFSAVGSEFQNPLFENQAQSIQYIVDALADKNDVTVYLRMHPNLKGLKSKSVMDLYTIKAPNFSVIAPESTISTYKLIDECDVVLSFGSTTGVEATYWSKPSVLVGNSFYKDLDVTYNPSCKEELISMLLTINEVKDKLGALMYGYYLITFGKEFKYYNAETLFKGKFKNVRIMPNEKLQKLMQNKIVNRATELYFKTRG